jgi:hypothetical protein
MKRTTWTLLLLTVGLTGLSAGQTTIDSAALAKIRDEGMNRSKVDEPFDTFVNVIGPRLTGSPAHKRAADYAKALLDQWGMTNAHLEPWEFGRGWELQKLTIEMVEPRYMPLIGYAEAWTPSTPGEIVVPAVSTADKSADEIAAMPLAGAAVLTQPVVTAFIDKDREQPTLVPGARIGAPAAPRQGSSNSASAGAGARAGASAGAGAGATTGAQNPALAKAAVMIKPSRGTDGTVFVQAGRDNPANTQPAIVLAAEHYNIIARLLAHKIPVKLRINVQAKFYDADKKSYNVIADIPGADPVLKDEIVMLGAHLDSWHTATGATDNADGVAEVMEAFRIIKASGLQPRRTLRLAIWSGEEEGLYGSQHYVTDHLAGDAHKSEREKMDVYFNIDPGTGPIYGWYMENNAAAKTIFDAWLEPIKELGARVNVMPGIPSTDHLSFAPVGVPGFTTVQDYADYDTREHHTNVDTAERVNAADMRQASVVLAWFAYSAAMDTARIPYAAAPAAPAPGVAPPAAAEARQSPTGLVQGTLLTSTGAPIVGGRVQLRHVPAGLVAEETVSDVAGAFHFDLVASGDYNVTYVTAQGTLLALGQRFAVKALETITTTVRLATSAPAPASAPAPPPPVVGRTPKLTTVVGYLREGSSKPIPDAAVQLLDAKTSAVIASMRTNAKGDFQFPGIAPGTYVVVEIADKSEKILATGQPFVVFAGQTVSNYVRVKGTAIR